MRIWLRGSWGRVNYFTIDLVRLLGDISIFRIHLFVRYSVQARGRRRYFLLR